MDILIDRKSIVKKTSVFLVFLPTSIIIFLNVSLFIIPSVNALDCVSFGGLGGTCYFNQICSACDCTSNKFTIMPIMTITSPSNTTYAQKWVWANVTLNEAGSWCGVSLDGAANQTLTNSSGNWNLNLSVTLQGANNLRFYCNDTYGNMNGSSVNIVYFTVDPPTYSLNSTNSTLAGIAISHNLYWQDSASLSGYIFQFCNGTWNGTSCPQANWLAGWPYRKQHIIINSTGAGVGYQLNITICNGTGTDSGSVVYANGHVMNKDFSDVRITNSMGTKLLSIWNESVNSGTGNLANATIWFNDTDDLTAANSTIYVYYGYSGAPPVWNGTSTFIFFDDFSSGTIDWASKWQSYNHSLYSESNGKLRCANDGTNLTEMIETNKTYSGGISFEALERLDNTGAQSVQFLNPTVGAYFNDFEDFLWSSNRFAIVLHGNEYDTSYTADTVNYFRVVHKVPSSGSATAEIWLNNSLKATQSAVPSYTSGYIGFFAYAAGNLYVDWTFVRNYVSTEPAHGPWGIEENATPTGWVNDTWTNNGGQFTGTSSWSNVTKVINSNAGATIAWCVYANDSNNNWNSTSCSNPFNYTALTLLYSLNSTNSTSAGTAISHNLYWQDSASLSGYIFQFCNGTWDGSNCKGGWVNDTWTNNSGQFTGTSSWSNVTKVVNSTLGATIAWCFNVNDTSNNWNRTSCQSPFSYVTTSPLIYSLNSTNSTSAGALISHNLYWKDNVGTLSGYIFQFCNGTWDGSNCGGVGWVNDTWTNTGFSGTSSWSNVTKTVNSTLGATIAWCVYANDSYNYWSGTSCQSPFIYTTSSCQIYINSLPFSITQSNKYYCLITSSHGLAANAIQFFNSSNWIVQNSTLDCQGNNLDGSGSSNNYVGVYLNGIYARNNTVKNCNATNYNDGIYIYNGTSNNTIINNMAINDAAGIVVDTNSSNNWIANNTVINSTLQGILLFHNVTSNFIADNTLINNGDGLHICNGASNNTLTRNNITGGTNGILVHDQGWNPTSYNTFTYDNVSSASYGIVIKQDLLNTIYTTNNNVFANCPIANSISSDFALMNISQSNTFRNTNWTAARNILFYDINSTFAYNNRTDIELWLMTNVSAGGMVSRILNSWTQANISWNESIITGTVDAYYNITGLLASTNYTVFNFSSLVYTLKTDSYGNLPKFNISLKTLSGQIMVNTTVYMPPIYSLNSTNSTLAGSDVKHSLNWAAGSNSLSGYIFSWSNGANWTMNNFSADMEPATTQFKMTPTWSNYTIILNDTNKGNLGDTEVNQTTAGGNYGTRPMMNITDRTTHNEWIYTLWNLSAIPNTLGTTVTSSILGLYANTVYTTSSRTYQAWNTTNSWTETGITWTNQPGGQTVQNSTVIGTTSGVWRYWNVTNATQSQLYQTIQNMSIMINDTTAPTTTQIKSIWVTKENGTSTLYPQLKINYTRQDNPVVNANASSYDTNNNVYPYNVLQVITNISITVNVSVYNNTASYGKTSNPDLWLEVWDGTIWSVYGNMSISGTGNKTVYIPKNNNVYAWWSANPTQRNIRFLGRYMDANATTWDEINFTDAWVNISSTGQMLNDTWVSFSGGTWSNVTKTVNSTVNSQILWCVYANDTSNNWNGTSCQNPFSYYTSSGTASYLEVSLVYPPSSYYVSQNQTFTVNATVYCRGGSCGYVNGTVMYNGSSTNPDTPVNTTLGDKPFYVNENPALAMKQCPTNPLVQDEFCNITWIINATGNINSVWKLGVLFNTTQSGVVQNNTGNSTVTITGCIESVNVTWNSINFGTLNPNTGAGSNPAPGNSNNLYNITNLGTCNLKVWIKGTDLQNTTLGSAIQIGNLSWSNTSSIYNPSTVSNFSYNYNLINSTLSQNSKLTTFYWLNVPTIYSGNYIGTITVCGNYSTTCG